MRLLLLALLVVGLSADDAAVVTYRHGDTITVQAVPSQTPVHGSIRTIVLVNETKLTVKGTWDTNDIDVVLNGNTLRFNLKRPVAVPIGILGSSGIYYYALVQPVSPAAATDLSPVVQVIGDPTAAGSDRAPQAARDPGERSGGHWEHATNSALRLHKHIRGGRLIPQVIGTPHFDELAMREKGIRVPGRIWTQADDWRVREFYSWTLDGVTAHYIGVTYTGRREVVEFEYLRQQTDRSLFIWHQRRPEAPQAYALRRPVVQMTAGTEEFFILYTKDVP
jgi:hypothetical protein